eukprot:Nitzschia sp. Nitz4//scaffold126_size65214//56205//56375//NITZ4_006166-RA/size65214-exonerate_protein2genome-gene-0.7-mRNA-1//-1//CDS//3329534719//2735//frame0
MVETGRKLKSSFPPAHRHRYEVMHKDTLPKFNGKTTPSTNKSCARTWRHYAKPLRL